MSEHERQAQHVWVNGRVQGVAFRWYTREEAKRLGLTGWVRNLADGRVEVWAEGTEDAVSGLGDWLHRGPPNAVVSAVEVEDVDIQGFDSFTIRSDG